MRINTIVNLSRKENKMKKENKVVSLAVMLALLAAPACFAEGAPSEGGSAVVSGFGQVLKFPVTVLDKLSDSLENSKGGTAVSEDVAVSDIYDLGAETTG